MSEETVRLIQVIKDAIESRLVDLNTCIPAVVISFSATDNTVDVQPAIQRKYADGTVKNLPTIKGVPVLFPSSAKALVSFPLYKGDSVTLVFSQRSLDVWKSNGGVVNPQEGRKFNISDAYCFPGGRPTKLSSKRVTSNSMRVEFGSSSIELFEDGTFKLGKINGQELLTILSDLAQAASQISNASGPIFNAAAFAALKVRIDSLKGA